MGAILIKSTGSVESAIEVLDQYSTMSGLNGKFQFIFEEIKNSLPKAAKKSEVA